jgi:hypothetical protein
VTTDDPSLFLTSWSTEGFPGDSVAGRARQYDRIAGFFSRLLLFDVNAKIKAILGEKEDTIKENDHVTSRNA